MDPSFKEQLLAEIGKIRAETGATEAEAYALLRRMANSDGDEIPLRQPPYAAYTNILKGYSERERGGKWGFRAYAAFLRARDNMGDGTPVCWQTFMAYRAIMDERHKRYREGRRGAALEAFIYHDIMAFDLPIPTWLSEHLAEGIAKFLTWEVKTLDEVLRNPRRKGFNLKAARREYRLRLPVWHRCIRLIEQGRPIDDGLFEEVGEELGIGKTLAKKYFYTMKKTDTTTR